MGQPRSSSTRSRDEETRGLLCMCACMYVYRRLFGAALAADDTAPERERRRLPHVIQVSAYMYSIVSVVSS